MRHRKSGRKLGMDSSHRKATFRNMVTSLMLHGTIRTTEPRAKELRRIAERLITIGKNAPSEASLDGLSDEELANAKAKRVHAIRRIKLWVNHDDALKSLMGDYAERFRTRPGGYTRIVKAGMRGGDNARMAVIQLVEEWDGVSKKSKAPVSADEEKTVAIDAGEVEAAEGTLA